MPLLPILKPAEVIRALQQAGFVVVRQRGSHLRMQHSDGRAVTVPIHGKDIKRGLLHKIIREAQLLPEDFLKLL